MRGDMLLLNPTNNHGTDLDHKLVSPALPRSSRQLQLPRVFLLPCHPLPTPYPRTHPNRLLVDVCCQVAAADDRRPRAHHVP